MATSDTKICNLALSQIGVGRIADIEGVTQVERDCKAVYDTARDEVLSDFDWAFARMRAELAQLNTPPAFGYTYAYQLPSDLLTLRSVKGLKEETVNFEIYGDQLHCDLEDDCFITYTRQITNPVLFSVKFVTALSYRLSAILANTVKKNQDMSMQWWDVYATFLPTLEARSEGRSEHPAVSQSNPFVEAR